MKPHVLTFSTLGQRQVTTFCTCAVSSRKKCHVSGCRRQAGDVCCLRCLVPVHPLSTSSSTQYLFIHSVPLHPLSTSSSTQYLFIHSVPVHPLSTCSSTQYLFIHSVPLHPLSTSSSTQYLFIHSVPLHPLSTSSSTQFPDRIRI